MFASASLDGAIVLWSTHSLNCTKQFNSVENYEGPNHMYPNSIQSVFTVDQVLTMKNNMYPKSIEYILLWIKYNIKQYVAY